MEEVLSTRESSFCSEACTLLFSLGQGNASA